MKQHLGKVPIDLSLEAWEAAGQKYSYFECANGAIAEIRDDGVILALTDGEVDIRDIYWAWRVPEPGRLTPGALLELKLEGLEAQPGGFQVGTITRAIEYLCDDDKINYKPRDCNGNDFKHLR